MIRTPLIVVPALIAVVAAISCAQEDLGGGNQPAKGGSTGSGTGGAPAGQGGATTGAGGSTTGNGGSTTTGAGGNTTGNGGSTTAGAGGNTTGNGGATAGGNTSAGGATAGGSSSTGGTAGSGSATGGSGGQSSGGSSATGGKSNAAGGSGGGSGGAAMIDTATFFEPALDGWYWEVGTTNGQDPGGNNYWLTDAGANCPQNSDWAKAGVTRTKTFKAKGTTGTKYTINFEIRGAMGMRCYTGGTAAQMQAMPNGVNNGWYIGGQQYNNSIWNTYQLDVANPPAMGEPANTYFLNGVPSTSGTCDQELTYEVKYTAKFAVMGDSTLTFQTHDANCKAQQNCGPTPSASCVPRQINLSGMSPATTVTQPVANAISGKTFYPQWFLFDVKSITTP